jgi:hypothetical protein
LTSSTIYRLDIFKKIIGSRVISFSKSCDFYMLHIKFSKFETYNFGPTYVIHGKIF